MSSNLRYYVLFHTFAYRLKQIPHRQYEKISTGTHSTVNIIVLHSTSNKQCHKPREERARIIGHYALRFTGSYNPTAMDEPAALDSRRKHCHMGHKPQYTVGNTGRARNKVTRQQHHIHRYQSLIGQLGTHYTPARRQRHEPACKQRQQAERYIARTIRHSNRSTIDTGRRIPWTH